MGLALHHPHTDHPDLPGPAPITCRLVVQIDTGTDTPDIHTWASVDVDVPQDEDGPDWDAVDSILETAAAEFDDLYQAGEYPCPAHRVALWRDGVELADWTP